MVRGCAGCLALLAVFLALTATGCSKKQNPAAATSPAVPVRVATAVQKTVPLQVRAIGAVEAYSTVGVKAQVSGELTAVHFREGQDVRKGQLLFEIYRPPFEAALQQAEATLARDKARAENARAQAQRYTRLFEEGVVSREQFDQQRTEANAMDAMTRADEAAVAKAKLDLEYCAIRSPLDGRTGSLKVNRGNVVKANDDSPMVVINQVNPIYVNFALPEQYLADVKKYMSARRLRVEAAIPESTPGSIQATATRPGQAAGNGPGPSGETLTARAAERESGAVTFVDNAVDSATGTIRLKASFANQQRRLWPGQFVEVVLTLTEQPNATVVPAPAVLTGQSGQYVFVVKSDGTVESRPVVAGRTVENETIVEQGLQPGETVVTDGQLRLVPGARVQVKE